MLFCHADDTLAEHAVERIRLALEQRGYPDRYVLWGHSLFRDYSIPLTNAGFDTGKPFAGIAATRPFLRSGLTPSGTCYSRDFIDGGGFFPTGTLEPSDSSSMVRAALEGFRFEMIEDILFYRRNASTAIGTGAGGREVENRFRAAWKPLLDRIDDTTAAGLVHQSHVSRWVNPSFYACLAQLVPRTVARYMTLRLLTSPIHALRPRFLQTYLRTLLRTLLRSVFRRVPRAGA